MNAVKNVLAGGKCQAALRRGVSPPGLPVQRRGLASPTRPTTLSPLPWKKLVLSPNQIKPARIAKPISADTYQGASRLGARHDAALRTT
jgi:hypothetical protein